MTYITIKTTKDKALAIASTLHIPLIKAIKNEYDFFEGDYESIHIHAYTSKKKDVSITFSGKEEEEVEVLVRYFFDDFEVKTIDEAKKRNISSSWLDTGCQIGSDEVGKGDFFGPLVVCASYVQDTDISYLKSMRIDDSKKMNDDYIQEIAPLLKKKIPNYIVMISAEKLSRLHESGFNIDRVLSLTHNLAQSGLCKKYQLENSIPVYIDQFLKEANYRKYVKDDIISNPLVFKTKGESYYPSVAVASVLARDAFLKEWKHMESVFSYPIPKGASGLVDNAFGVLKNRYGEGEVSKYVKKFFSNYKKRS